MDLAELPGRHHDNCLLTFQGRFTIVGRSLFYSCKNENAAIADRKNLACNGFLEGFPRAGMECILKKETLP